MAHVEKIGFAERISHFVEKYRTIVIVFSLLIVAVVTFLFVNDLNTQNLNMQTSVAIEKIEQTYSEWEIAEEGVKATSEAGLIVVLDEAAQKDGALKQFALYYKARYSFQKKLFNEAYDLFLQSASVLEASFLSPSAVYLAAVSAENANEIEKAKALYNQISSGDSEKNTFVPRALFSMGRILESEKKYKEAESFYQQVVDKFNVSNWTKLAKNRIIFLKANSLL